MVNRLIAIRRQSCIRAFIRFDSFGKTQGVAAERICGFANRKREHRGRIEPAAQKKPDWHIADHMEAKGLFKQLRGTRLGIAIRNRRLVELQVPVLSDSDATS